MPLPIVFLQQSLSRSGAKLAASGKYGAEELPAELSRSEQDVLRVVLNAPSEGIVVVRLGDELSDEDTVRTFFEKVVLVLETQDTRRQEAAIAKLADVILPDPLADARGVLALDNLELRDRFVRETAPLTSAEISAQAGHKSSNPYATAARWKRAGDIFSVHHRGTEYFPAFQFRDGQPHPVIGQITAALPNSMTPWQRALWFVSTNGWLGDRAPAEALDDLEAVLVAARREGEEVIG